MGDLRAERTGRYEFSAGLRRGLGIGTGTFLSLLVLTGSVLLAGEFYQFAAGDLISASKINQNFNVLRNEQIAPIGSIVAWHRDLSGTPSIPPGWSECDGSTVSDAESPLNGQPLPDLNGGARFLRGGANSGTLEDHAFQDHGHAITPNPHDHTLNRLVATDLTAGPAGVPNTSFGASWWYNNTENFIINGTSLTVGGASSGNPQAETRPANMAVIWIIRIK